MARSANIQPNNKVNKIIVPSLIAESTGLQGFAFSHKLFKTGKLRKLNTFANPKAAADKSLTASAAKKAVKMAKDADGGPGVGENYISIAISNDHENAGSRADKIFLYFGGKTKYLRLWGLDRSGERFPKGRRITWDMSVGSTDPEDWIESVRADAWDDLMLVNKTGDGILIDNIKIVHSSFTIVDWPPPGEAVWLDGSRGEKYGIIGLADQILQKKLEAIPADLRWVPQLHWAALELGKTDGTKYGTRSAWCSEFASWCLRKAGWWNAPKPPNVDGNIGSKDMQDYFQGKSRKYTKQQLLDGEYRLIEGDYLRFNNHSALFIQYEDDGRAITDSRKRFIAIDGNWGSTVTLSSGSRREIRDLISVGCTR
jgi:hypothetical protein